MNIDQLTKLFECKSVASINRMLGRSYDILEDVKEIRNVIIKEYCDDNGLQICNTDEEIIQASLSGQVTDAANALAANGIIVTQIDSANNGSMERINSYQDEKAKVVAEPTDSAKPISDVEPQKQSFMPFKMIPKTTYSWACPYCDKERGEKDLSFKSAGDFMYSHDCEQGSGKFIQHPEIDKARAELKKFTNGLSPNNSL